MLPEIIRQLAKAEENADITSEQVLGWEKRVEAQRTQSAIMDSLTETKEFDKVKIEKGGLRYNGKICKHMPKCLQNRATVIVVPAIYPDNTWLKGRSVQTVAR